MRIGILSDTHGQLDSRVLELFQGVDRILHAGDVGGPEILDELSALAPVTAVAGNTDGFPLVDRLKKVEFIALAGERIALIHQIGSPDSPARELRDIVCSFLPSFIVFGHTHSPWDKTLQGVRYVNPGAAGPRRFSLPRTIAILELAPPSSAQLRFLPLDERSEAILMRGVS
jgi:putative phosphoesterase